MLSSYANCAKNLFHGALISAHIYTVFMYKNLETCISIEYNIINSPVKVCVAGDNNGVKVCVAVI